MAAIIKGAEELRKLLRSGEMGKAILPALTKPLRAAAFKVLIRAQSHVPRGESNKLYLSSGVDAEVNEANLSATATTYYAAPHAPYVHEGVHGHVQKDAPPKWLEASLPVVSEGELASDVGEAAMGALAKYSK